jgi:hypothetical protein
MLGNICPFIVSGFGRSFISRVRFWSGSGSGSDTYDILLICNWIVVRGKNQTVIGYTEMNNSGFYNIFFLISKNQIDQGCWLKIKVDLNIDDSQRHYTSRKKLYFKPGYWLQI